MADVWVEVRGKDGPFGAYMAAPKSGKGPGVVVIQEIFGINAFVRNVANWLAEKGYMALAPDLFWRIQPHIQLDPTVPDQFQKGLEYYGKFSAPDGVTDIQATITALRKLPGCNGKVGNLGFCLGGALSYLAACNTDTDASSSYYGVGIDQMLGQATQIKKPTILHLAGNDAFVSKDAQAKIKAELGRHPLVTIHEYPGRDHGFCRDTDARHYNAADCNLAHQRTLDLFSRTLA